MWYEKEDNKNKICSSSILGGKGYAQCRSNQGDMLEQNHMRVYLSHLHAKLQKASGSKWQLRKP